VIEGFDMFGAVPSGTVNDLGGRACEAVGEFPALAPKLPARRGKFLALPHRRFPRKLLESIMFSARILTMAAEKR
jgi:hypothetical protein